MKYVSLIGIMQIYGGLIKEKNRYAYFNQGFCLDGLDPDEDYRFFNIHPYMNTETGQAMVTLTQANRKIYELIGYRVPERLDIPPILEIEWMKSKLDLDENTIYVLEQMGYFYIMKIVNEGAGMIFDWTDYMTTGEAIVEIEELEDAPDIMSERILPAIPLPNCNSWQYVLMYGTNFCSLFNKCYDQLNTMKEMYFNLPVLFGMFMFHYYHNKLGDYFKSNRLDCEYLLKAWIEKLDKCLESAKTFSVEKYTYGLTRDVTVLDVQLMLSVFTSIYDLIHDLNSDMGLIAYSVYDRITGPETVKASIRLSGMPNSWEDEMTRAENADSGNDDDDEDKDKQNDKQDDDQDEDEYEYDDEDYDDEDEDEVP